MTDSSLYKVLLAHAEARDPMVIAKALASARKTPLQDQMMAAKSGWGILASDLSEPDAQALSLKLGASGVETIICPQAAFVSLPAAESAANVSVLPTSAPVLIAAAAITISSTTTKTVKEGPSGAQKILSTAILLGTGLPIRIGGKERSVEKTQQHSDLQFILDLLYQDPACRWRISADHFDYAFLKERKQYQVLGNFKLLLGDFVKSSPAAWKNHGTQVFLEGKPMQTMGYGSLADLEKEERWLLTLKSLGR